MNLDGNNQMTDDCCYKPCGKFQTHCVTAMIMWQCGYFRYKKCLWIVSQQMRCFMVHSAIDKQCPAFRITQYVVFTERQFIKPKIIRFSNDGFNILHMTHCVRGNGYVDLLTLAGSLKIGSYSSDLLNKWTNKQYASSTTNFKSCTDCTKRRQPDSRRPYLKIQLC